MTEIMVRIEQKQPKAVMQQARPVIQMPIGLQGPAGEAANPTVTVTAGQTISSGRVLVIDGGKAYYFQPGTIEHVGRAYGISRSSGVLDGQVTVQISGEITDASFFTFTADTALWVWANGEIKNTLPTGVPIIQKAGIATGNRKLKIDLSFTAIKQV
jgi:hypothetical protein